MNRPMAEAGYWCVEIEHRFKPPGVVSSGCYRSHQSAVYKLGNVYRYNNGTGHKKTDRDGYNDRLMMYIYDHMSVCKFRGSWISERCNDKKECQLRTAVAKRQTSTSVRNVIVIGRVHVLILIMTWRSTISPLAITSFLQARFQTTYD